MNTENGWLDRCKHGALLHSVFCVFEMAFFSYTPFQNGSDMLKYKQQ